MENFNLPILSTNTKIEFSSSQCFVNFSYGISFFLRQKKHILCPLRPEIFSSPTAKTESDNNLKCKLEIWTLVRGCLWSNWSLFWDDEVREKGQNVLLKLSRGFLIQFGVKVFGFIKEIGEIWQSLSQKLRNWVSSDFWGRLWWVWWVWWVSRFTFLLALLPNPFLILSTTHSPWSRIKVRESNVWMFSPTKTRLPFVFESRSSPQNVRRTLVEH
jgi:hypothetical protein